MIDTKALREKVLDLAIRGKLVPQDPNDEPATVLLERIREQKKQMVKDGKLKAKDIKNDTIIFKGDDNLHYEQFADGTVKCIEDEIPFDVPDGWCWCRLGSISAAIQYGLSNSAEQSGTHRLLRITDIQDGKVDWDTVPFTTVYEAENYLLSSGDIVFARTGATVGKSFLIKELPYPAVYASYLIRIRLLDGVLPDYIYQFFSSQCYWEQITDKSVGVGQPNCNGTSLKELFIPIPPFSEQNRIVPSALSALEYVINIELDKASLLETVTSIKFKILDLAIRGQLIPQDPNDEPASVLLDRIRAEKEEFIKAGKIKRDKKESVIFKGDDNSYYEKVGAEVTCIDDEIQFEVPENYTVCRLETVVNIYTGNSINESEKSSKYTGLSNGYNYIATKDVSFNNKINYFNGIKIPFDEHKFKIAVTNDVLLCIEGGSAGRKIAILEQDVCFVNKLCAFHSLGIHPKYLYYFLQSPQFKSVFKKNTSGLIGGVSVNVLKRLLILIPPITVQERTVNKIEEIFNRIDSIEQSLN